MKEFLTSKEKDMLTNSLGGKWLLKKKAVEKVTLTDGKPNNL